MNLKDISPWIPIVGALLAAGMWLGSLSTRVALIERNEVYLHGSLDSSGVK